MRLHGLQQPSKLRPRQRGVDELRWGSMETIRVALGKRSYPIHIGRGLIGDSELLQRSIPAAQVMIVTNERSLHFTSADCSNPWERNSSTA